MVVMSLRMRHAFIMAICCIYYGVNASTLYDMPGVYAYGSGIIADPTQPNDSIITIAASNIILDLGDQAFEQYSLNTVPNFDGIIIQSGASNVTIRNGTIQKLTGRGIVIEDGCSEVRFENITISDCTNYGIAALGESGISEVGIYNCSITDIKQGDQLSAGVYLQNCSKIIIDRVTVQGFEQASETDCMGFRFVSANAFQMTDCKAIQHMSKQLSAGYYFDSSNDGIVKNCLVYSCITLGDAASLSAGFYLTGCQRIWISKSQSALNMSLSGQSIGFYSESGSRNIFDNLVAQLNTASQNAAGFWFINEQRSYINNNMIRGNESSKAQAAGIKLEGCSLCCITENTLINNIGAESFGIVDAASPSSSVITLNYAFNNSKNYQVSYSNGVTLPILNGSLTQSDPGLPLHVAGLLDNISINP